MREILFRGKHTRTGEWVEGLLWKKKYRSDKFFISCFPDKDDNEEAFIVFPETIGQYTGLIDKNGNRIFEGDIIKQIFRLKQTNGCCEREVMSVIEYGISWSYSDVCGVCQRFRDGSGMAMLSVMDSTNGIVDCEIIGNIHDNPELLKGGE